MRRYGLVTSVLYDVFSAERPLYRPGRLLAIQALRLSAGDRVLVLGCGTGLDLPLVAAAIGPTGTIIAVDDSPAMLQRSGSRARTLLSHRRQDWPTVRLVQADLTRARTVLPPGEGPVDAVLAINTLSLIPEWRRAWRTGLAAARPGARVAVADIGRPDPGHLSLDLWSKWISAVGLGDLDAHPWVTVGREADDVQHRGLWSGHVHVAAGTTRG